MDYEAGADIFKGWTVTGKGKEGAAGSFYEIRKKHCGRTIKKGLKVLQVPGSDLVSQARHWDFSMAGSETSSEESEDATT